MHEATNRNQVTATAIATHAHTGSVGLISPHLHAALYAAQTGVRNG